jgi:inositol phosphorylceramide mannosyltransferase catalytic subunit
MRRGLLIFLLINFLIIAFLVRSVFTLLSLLVEDASADAIHRSEIPAPNSPLIDSRPQLIPKIIHQTYVNESIPEHWREAQQSCIDLHEDYEYKVRNSRRCPSAQRRERLMPRVLGMRISTNVDD